MSKENSGRNIPETLIEDALEISVLDMAKDEDVIADVGTVDEHDSTNGFLYYNVIDYQGNMKSGLVGDHVLFQTGILKKGDPIKFICRNGNIVRVEKSDRKS